MNEKVEYTIDYENRATVYEIEKMDEELKEYIDRRLERITTAVILLSAITSVGFFGCLLLSYSVWCYLT